MRLLKRMRPEWPILFSKTAAWTLYSMLVHRCFSMLTYLRVAIPPERKEFHQSSFPESGNYTHRSLHETDSELLFQDRVSLIEQHQHSLPCRIECQVVITSAAGMCIEISQ